MSFPQPQVSTELYRPRVLGIAGDLITGPLHLGIQVERATATLPQTTQSPLFTITGGYVLVTQIVGEVTIVIQTQVNGTQLVGNPTVGVDTDLCADLDITADAVGTLYGITGILADAMLGVGPGALQGQTVGVVLNVGSLDLDCAASNTGAVKWRLWYIPLSADAQMVAA